MKYLPLIWSGVWRKRTRALLMLLQIASAFVLFGVLQGLDTGVNQAISRAHADRLYVTSRVAVGDPLPIGILARIRSIPGVRYVTERASFGGTYQKPDQFVPVEAVGVDTFFKIYADLKVSPQAIAALERDRSGGIAGVDAMKKYGWKIGDHVVLQTPVPKTDGSRDWGFDIVGTYDVTDPSDSASTIITDFPYLNEGRLTGRDHAAAFVAKIDDPKNAGTISLAIDNAFANSSHETRTMSEADLIATQLQQVGDLDYIVHGVIGAVFFALLFATGALMMQSLRERIPELAVLKTVGFSDRRVMALILVESIALCVFAALVGLGIASFLLPIARQLVGVVHMPGIVVAAGIGCAVALALIGGSVPAWRGSTLQVADALAGR